FTGTENNRAAEQDKVTRRYGGGQLPMHPARMLVECVDVPFAFWVTRTFRPRQNHVVMNYGSRSKATKSTIRSSVVGPLLFPSIFFDRIKLAGTFAKEHQVTVGCRLRQRTPVFFCLPEQTC